jgi:3-deoxy-manno-octulosonate cytidylyltransferase (CMP-KDO synthetase)
MRFIGIIPARYASSRFPGKPLADMAGKPMIQRVYEQVRSTVDTLVVATDDQRILDAVLNFGGHAVLTSQEHQSGTDRCHEALLKVSNDLCDEPLPKTGSDFDVVINIQGDEPFIQPEQIGLLKDCFSNEDTQIATLAIPIDADSDARQTIFNPNMPKVVLNNQQEALYFSRSPIPFVRGKENATWIKAQTFYKHIGLYAYRADVLKAITALPQSSLEIAESLEQLRWLQNGYKIKVAITHQETIGIDTPEDLEKARIQLKVES